MGAANSLWATFGWGNGFLCVSGRDDREYTENPLLCRLADVLTGVTSLDRLAPAKAKAWGFTYMTARGLYQYPLYVSLALLNPYAPLIGLGCLLQGTCYRLVGLFPEREWNVVGAELLFGAVTGLLISLCL